MDGCKQGRSGKVERGRGDRVKVMGIEGEGDGE